MLLLPVVAPLLISPILLILPPRRRKELLLLYLAGLVAVALSLFSGTEPGDMVLATSLFEVGNEAVPLFFSVHPLGRIAAFGFLVVGAFSLLYGLDVAKKGEQALALAAIGSAVAIALSGNFVTLFIFWELLTLSVAGLISLGGTSGAGSMGYRFLLVHLGGGFLLFLGIMQHYAATGSFLLAVPEAGLPFFLLGIGIKAVFLPLHVWLPWSYPSASFASSVVLAGLTTKAGVFALARILPAGSGIMYMGACMAVFGAALAILQSDLRRLLSYHIISQVGFMVAAIGLGLHLSVDGGLLHMLNHMFYKALLFMSAGAVIFSTGKENLHDLYSCENGASELPSVWSAIPLAALGAVVGALAIAGMPLLNGFVSKSFLKAAFQGAGPVEQMLWLAGVGTAISFSKFVYFGFFKGRARIRQVMTIPMKAAIIGVSSCCFFFGIWPGLLSPLLPFGSSLAVYSLQGVWGSLQIICLGIMVFVVIAWFLSRGIVFPVRLSIEGLVYEPLIKAFEAGFTFTGRIIHEAADGFFTGIIPQLALLSFRAAGWDNRLEKKFLVPLICMTKNIYTKAGGMLDQGAEGLLVRSVAPLGNFTRAMAFFHDRALRAIGEGAAMAAVRLREGIYNAWRNGIVISLRLSGIFLRRIGSFLIKVDYNPNGERLFLIFNIMNFDFAVVLVITILLLMLAAGIFLL